MWAWLADWNGMNCCKSSRKLEHNAALRCGTAALCSARGIHNDSLQRCLTHPYLHSLHTISYHSSDKCILFISLPILTQYVSRSSWRASNCFWFILIFLTQTLSWETWKYHKIVFIISWCYFYHYFVISELLQEAGEGLQQTRQTEVEHVCLSWTFIWCVEFVP